MLVMKDKGQAAAPGQGPSRGSGLSTEQTFVAWAAVVMGAVFMAAGSVVMVLSLS
jgi:hypothetical protein